MRKAVACLAVLAVCAGPRAQDGIYGTFLVGQKFIDLQPLNEEIKKLSYVNEDLFPSNKWTIGGEGHLVLGDHLVLGGKGFGIFQEKSVPGNGVDGNADATLGNQDRRFRITGGMGVAQVGISPFKPNNFGLRIYPQIGLGVSSFLFQTKRTMPDDYEGKTFEAVLKNETDDQTTLGKVGLIIDFAASLDWYKPFKHFFTIVPNLDFGPMLHLEAGYSILPADLAWRRDVDLGGKDQVEGGPDLKFNGFYFNLGLGFGLSAQ